MGLKAFSTQGRLCFAALKAPLKKGVKKRCRIVQRQQEILRALLSLKDRPRNLACLCWSLFPCPFQV